MQASSKLLVSTTDIQHKAVWIVYLLRLQAGIGRGHCCIKIKLKIRFESERVMKFSAGITGNNGVLLMYAQHIIA